MEHLLDHYAYLALFVVTFVSALGIPVGSEIAIGYGGALASGQITGVDHHFSLALVIVVAVAGELVGSLAGYAIGYFGGRPLVDRYGRYLLLSHRDLDRAEAWFDGRGEWTALVGRLIPLLRSFVSVVAGLAEMSLGLFVVFTVIGSAMACSALAALGYSLGATWHHVLKSVSYAGYAAAVVVVILIVLAVVHRLQALRHEDGGRPRAAHARRR